MMNLTFGLVVASCIAGAALAQGVTAYQQTGVINVTLGAEEVTHYTAWNTVPGDATRQVHTASWLILKPMLVGGVNISHDDLLVPRRPSGRFDMPSFFYGQTARERRV